MARPERMSRADEERALLALDRLADRVDAGEHPTDAMAKVAADLDLPPGHVQFVSSSFNIGRANQQRRQGASLFDKAASVPLIDQREVLRRLYPTSVKSANEQVRATVVSSDYLAPPERFVIAGASNLFDTCFGTVKSASTCAPDADKVHAAAYDALASWRRTVENKRAAVTAAQLKAASALEDFQTVVSRDRHDLPPFSLVQRYAEAAHGGMGAALCRRLATDMPWLAKQARREPSYRYPYTPQASPYRELTACIQAMRDYQLAKEAYVKAANSETAREVRRCIDKRGAADDSGGSGGTGGSGNSGGSNNKPPGFSFGGWSDMRKGFGGVAKNEKITQLLGGMANTAGLSGPGLQKALDLFNPEEARREAYEELTDPGHELRLRTIQTKALVQDLMANDPVISGYPADDVVRAFNELHRLAPNAASQPALARALLRRQLAQGQLDTHDFEQLTGIEKNIADAESRRAQARMQSAEWAARREPRLLRMPAAGRGAPPAKR